MVRLVIFHNNETKRSSLAALINEFDDYQIAGNFPNVLGVKDKIKQLRPHLVIISMELLTENGISTIRMIKEMEPELSIVTSVEYEEAENIFRSLCAGADGYFIIKNAPSELYHILNAVRAGGAFMSPAIAKRILTSLRSSSRQEQLIYGLTPREKQVLRLLIRGCSVKNIAAELNIAFETGRSHLKNIYSKLNVNCGREAIAKVLADRNQTGDWID